MKRLLGILSIFMIAGCSGSPQPAADRPASAPTAPLSGIDAGGMDKRVDPQDDFYRYVNGRWLDQTEIPPDKALRLLYQDRRRYAGAVARSD